jgi:hypothetical protein
LSLLNRHWINPCAAFKTAVQQNYQRQSQFKWFRPKTIKKVIQNNGNAIKTLSR